jgi:hypothetical protein
MKLNRAQALFLVGTIAAVACTVEDGDGDDDGGAGGNDSGGSAGSSGKGGSVGTAGKGGTAGKASMGGAAGTEGGGAGAAGTAGEAGQGGRAPAGAGGSGGDDRWGQSGSYGGTDYFPGGGGGQGNEAGSGPTCDESAASSVSCDGVDASRCADIETFLNDQCAIAAQVLKGYVADSVRSCMIGLSAEALCDSTNTYTCFREGLRASCPDAGVEDDCAEILSSCEEGTVSATDCSTYLSGMTEEGRAQMVACISASDPLSCDLWSCAEGLDYPSVE